MPLGYAIFFKNCALPLSLLFHAYFLSCLGPQCCLYNLLEGQPESIWPLGEKHCIISNPSRYSGLYLPCFLQHVWQQHLSVNRLRQWQAQMPRSPSVGISSRAVGPPGISFPLWELALKAVWTQILTTFSLKLQTYPRIKSPLHFYGTSRLLPLISLFFNHLPTPTTRTLPPCRQHCSTLLIVKILLMPLTGPDNPLICHYFCYYLK